MQNPSLSLSLSPSVSRSSNTNIFLYTETASKRKDQPIVCYLYHSRERRDVEKHQVETERIWLFCLFQIFHKKRENHHYHLLLQLHLKRKQQYYSNLWRVYSTFRSHSVWLLVKAMNIQIYILRPQSSKKEWKFTMIMLDVWHWSCKRIKILRSNIELILNLSDRSGWDTVLFIHADTKWQLVHSFYIQKWAQWLSIQTSCLTQDRQFFQV